MMRVRRRLVVQVAQSILESTPGAVKDGFVDPVAIAEAHGIIVRKAPLEGSLSGFLITTGKGVTFIGVNEQDGLQRQRFTIAHELGHHFLHDRGEPFLDTVTGKSRVMARDDVSASGTDVREIEANLFAAELLMPQESIERDLQAHQFIDLFGEEIAESVISELATKYKVSVRAMTVRLERLGFLSDA